jgi:hypothetical protein
VLQKQEELALTGPIVPICLPSKKGNMKKVMEEGKLPRKIYKPNNNLSIEGAMDTQLRLLEEATQRRSDVMQKHCRTFFLWMVSAAGEKLTLDVIKEKKWEMRSEPSDAKIQHQDHRDNWTKVVNTSKQMEKPTLETGGCVGQDFFDIK